VATPTLITISGTFVKANGTPETGTLEFYSKVFVLESDGDTAVVPSVIHAPLDHLGQVSIAIPATNDPDWRPLNWQYTLVMKLSNAYTSMLVHIPYDAPDGILPVSQLIPISGATTTPIAGPHTHAAADIVTGTISIARLPVGTSHTAVAYGDHTHEGGGDHNHDDRYFTETEVTTALNLKANLASPTFTGTVNGITKAMVGLGNVDNTADISKPVSSAQQVALNGKAATVHTHAIADTTGLQTALDAKAAASHTHTIANVTGLQTALDAKAATTDLADKANVSDVEASFEDVNTALNLKADSDDVDTALATKADSSTVTSALALKADSSTVTSGLALKAPLASPTFTGNVSGVTKTHVGLGSVDNTADSAKPVSTAQQTALNLKANLASPAFTGNPTGITKTHVGLANVDNTTDAGKPISTATQTALDLKAPLASPTFTGTVNGVTKTHVGLANVDNTADTAKPVSTAQQTALNAKPDVYYWNGTAYAIVNTGDIYVGPNDPGSVGDGSIWIDTTP
jgi:tail-like repeat protein